jgi:beta-N-acetylglucosaminidase
MVTIVTIGMMYLDISDKNIALSKTRDNNNFKEMVTLNDILKIYPISKPIPKPVEQVETKKVVEQPVVNKPDEELYVVIADMLNIRADANSSSKIVGLYYKEDIISVIDKSDKWFKTQLGFVYSDYLVLKDEYKNTIQSTPKVASRGITVQRKNTSASISEPSYLSVEDIAKLIRGTNLQGTEFAIYEIEKEYGVNALFTLAICKLESDLGSSSVAKNKNNLFGAKTDNGYIRYTSKIESIKKFGQFMKSLYIDQGLVTLKQINPKYCPPNSEWKNKVASIMSTFISKIN